MLSTVSLVLALTISFGSAAPTLSAMEPSPLVPLCTNPSSRTDSCKLVNPEVYVNHTWYEQGRTWIVRNTFERRDACVTASYAFKEDGKNIRILNRAVDEKKNKVAVVEGTRLHTDLYVGNAEVLSSSQFKVRFGDQTTAGQIGLWFQNLSKGPNYYILNVWTDDSSPTYKLALVTNGKKWLDIITDIWILADKPSISDEEMELVLDYAVKAGYNPKNSFFERTPCTESQRLLLP